MNAKELRIGNLINVGGCTIDTYQIYTPCVVNIGMLKQIQEENKEQPDAILSVWQPIPLTEEWMLKFGFEKYDDGGELKGNDCFYGIKKTGIVIGLTPKFNLSGYKPAKRIEYVHQLQNLYFALTGTELEIINS